MQNPMVSTFPGGLPPVPLHAATDPVGHVDRPMPLRPDHPPSGTPSRPSTGDRRRRNPKKPEAEAPASPEPSDHLIDDYA